MKIKKEPDDNNETINHPITQATTTTTTTTQPTINEEDLIQIKSSKHLINRKYPPGCPIWYNFQYPDANYSKVKQIYTNLATTPPEYVYRLRGIEDAENKHIYFREHELLYAPNCTVKVTKVECITNENEAVDAIILCPEERDYNTGKISYTVQYRLENSSNDNVNNHQYGQALQIERGVDEGRISYRESKKEEVKTTTEQTSAAQDTTTRPTENSKEDGLAASTKPAAKDKNTTHNPLDKQKKGEKNPGNNKQDEHLNINGKQNPDNTTKKSAINSSLNGKTKSSDNTTAAVQRGISARSSSNDQQYQNTNNTKVSTLAYTSGEKQGTTDHQMSHIFKRSDSLPEGKLPASTSNQKQPAQPQTLNRSRSGEQHNNTTEGRWEPPSNMPPNQTVQFKVPPSKTDDATKALPRGSWRNDCSIDDSASGGQCGLTVPRWVTDLATRKELFFHIIGRSNMSQGQGYKTREIERVTGCRVPISKGIPMVIGVEAMAQATSHDEAKAKVMIENSLLVLEFLESESARTRLLSEWKASSTQGEMSRKRKPEDMLAIQANGDGSYQRPTKSPKVDENEATCILTVPLWVMQRCSSDKDLFMHILGNQPKRGYKTKEIYDQTGCSTSLSNDSGKNSSLVITISHANGTSSRASSHFNDLRRAKRMITESIMDFMCDPSSEMRLVYDLAMSATGTYNFRRAEGGVIQQECPSTHRLLWMKVLFLPLSNFHDKKWIPHGKFLVDNHCQERLIGNTNCTIEVFGFDDPFPVLSNGYVLISGSNSHDVVTVADGVDNALRDHQERCPYGCSFRNDSIKVEVGKVAQKSGKFYKGYDEY